jgi:hypothetical protein
MSVLGVDDSAAAYRTAIGHVQNVAKESSASEGQTDVVNSEKPSPATLVTLSDGTNSEVSVYSVKLKMVPMSVAMAPQLFVQGDLDGDSSLSRNEFAEQLKRVGVDDDHADQLFDEFNHSKGDALSLDDYVKGIIADNEGGNDIFQQLFSMYTSGKSGGLDSDAFSLFTAAGASVASQYWLDHPEILPRS